MLAQLIEYYIEKTPLEKLGCFKSNFSLLHWQEDSLAYLVLITALYLTWSNSHSDPWIEFGSPILAKYVIKVWT